MTRNDNIHRKEGAEFSGQKFSFYDAADGSLDLLFTTKLQEEAQVGCLRGVFLGEEVGDDVMVTWLPNTLHAFLRAVVVPEMQIKLKQGFGRAIRTETDTCVVAILDERAAKDQRYWKDVLTTLPEMPITQDLHQVEAFIRGVKPDSYFQERTA